MTDDPRATGSTLTSTRGTGSPATATTQHPPRAKKSRYQYDAHPASVRPCVTRLQSLYLVLDEATLESLRHYKTIAIGVVVEKSRPETPRLVWTASSNWSAGLATTWLDSRSVTRWDPDESRMPRGRSGDPIGAPGDAEQRMLSAADQNDFVVKAMAVSRPPCHDCYFQLAQYGNEYGQVVVEVVPPPSRPEQERREQLERVADGARRIRKLLELSEGEYMLQKQLIEKPSATGFVGYWVNHLHNADIPPVTIWAAAHGALAALDAELKRGDPLRAMAKLLRARREYVIALRQYETWKGGVEPAAKKAQAQIWTVAALTILAFLAPAMVARAAKAIRNATVAGRLAEASRAVKATEASHAEAMQIIARVEAKLGSTAVDIAEAAQEEASVEAMLESGEAATRMLP